MYGFRRYCEARRLDDLALKTFKDDLGDPRKSNEHQHCEMVEKWQVCFIDTVGQHSSKAGAVAGAARATGRIAGQQASTVSPKYQAWVRGGKAAMSTAIHRIQATLGVDLTNVRQPVVFSSDMRKSSREPEESVVGLYSTTPNKTRQGKRGMARGVVWVYLSGNLEEDTKTLIHELVHLLCSAAWKKGGDQFVKSVMALAYHAKNRGQLATKYADPFYHKDDAEKKAGGGAHLRGEEWLTETVSELLWNPGKFGAGGKFLLSQIQALFKGVPLLHPGHTRVNKLGANIVASAQAGTLTNHLPAGGGAHGTVGRLVTAYKALVPDATFQNDKFLAALKANVLKPGMLQKWEAEIVRAGGDANWIRNKHFEMFRGAPGSTTDRTPPKPVQPSVEELRRRMESVGIRDRAMQDNILRQKGIDPNAVAAPSGPVTGSAPLPVRQQQAAGPATGAVTGSAPLPVRQGGTPAPQAAVPGEQVVNGLSLSDARKRLAAVGIQDPNMQANLLRSKGFNV